LPEYIAITPARDEERFLPQLIACMSAQKHLPRRWTIIDDGSTDATGAIVDAAARQHPWIRPVHVPLGRPRLPGGESAIMQLLHEDAYQDVDYILRLDADISFGPSFAESLLFEFASDPKLGIASGMLYEPDDGGWHEVVSPAFHTHGPAKAYSCACFRAIGGLEEGLGWDTIDDIGASMLGFKTHAFQHIRVNHHRRQGTARGVWPGFFNKGQAAYHVGYSPIFLIARAIRMVAVDGPLGALAMTTGYLEGYVKRRPRVNNPELIRFVRCQQHRRLMMLDTVWR
jgi:glycosyltransferase involved in cell wall biosynthesis